MIVRWNWISIRAAGDNQCVTSSSGDVGEEPGGGEGPGERGARGRHRLRRDDGSVGHPHVTRVVRSEAFNRDSTRVPTRVYSIFIQVDPTGLLSTWNDLTHVAVSRQLGIKFVLIC